MTAHFLALAKSGRVKLVRFKEINDLKLRLKLKLRFKEINDLKLRLKLN